MGQTLRKHSLFAIALFTLFGVGCSGPQKMEDPAWCLAFSPDGKMLAAGRGPYLHPSTAKGEGYVVIWLTDSFAEHRVYRGDLTSGVEGVAFTGDGREIVAASDANSYKPGSKNAEFDGKRIYTWVVESGKLKSELVLRDSRDDEFMKYAGFVSQMTYSPDTRLVGLALSGDRPVVIDLKTGKPRYVPEGHDPNCTCLMFSPDGKTLASCSPVGRAHPPQPLNLSAADTGKHLAASDAGGTAPFCLAFSPKGDHLVVGCKGGEVVFMTGDLARVKRTVRVAESIVYAVAYSLKDERVAAATRDTVYLLDAKEAKVLRTLGEKLARVHAVAFSPDGKALAAAYGTQESAVYEKPAGGVLVWEVATGKLIKELK